MDPNIVILAAGVASRMKRPAPQGAALDPRLAREAASLSKGMLGVGRNARPFLDYLLLTVLRAGYREVIIVVGDQDETIRAYYRSGRGADAFPGLSLAFAQQSIPPGRTKPLGTADALLQALRSAPGWKGKKLTVCNSDNLYSRKALGLLLNDGHPNCMIEYDRDALLFDPERISRFAVIHKDRNGYLREIVEKPSAGEITGAVQSGGRIGVSMNIFRFSYDEILPCLEVTPLHPGRDEKELPVAVGLLVARNPRAMYTIPLSEHVIDLTAQGDIPIVQEYLAREFPDF